ncbi:autotransporter-associated beta strand repeat-containing protein [Akkermansiaceae bacterium]|nr:autotransporter-associated beta strand repeat-containing protein [Akkermansiaceae bacterium]
MRPALGSRWLSGLPALLMLVMVLGLPGELFAGTKKVKNDTDLSDYVTNGTFSDDIKFDKDNKTLFIDGDVSNVTLAGEIHVKDNKTGNKIEAESDFTGTVSLSADNEYNQDITLRGGTIAIIGSGRLGNGNFSGAIDLGSGGNTGTFKQNSSSAQIFSGTISGTGSLIKDNAGKLTLSGSNTSTGSTTIDGGILEVQGGSAMGDASIVTVNSGGTFEVDNSETIGRISGAGNLTLNAILTTGDATNSGFSGNISGTGGLFKRGASTMELTGSNTYTGVTTVDAGTLRMVNGSAGDAIFAAADAQQSYVVKNGATLEFSRALVNDAEVGTKNIKKFNLSGAGTFKKAGDAELRAFSNSTVAMSSGALFHVQSGLFTLGGNNNAADWSGNFSDLQVESDASIDGTGGAMRVNELNGGGTVLINGGITVGVDNGSGSFSGAIVDSALGSADTYNLTKEGSGTQTLSGANTFSGDTTISGGTLEIGGAGSLGSGTYAGAIANSGTFKQNSTANQTLSGVISGSGSLIKDNSGTLTLTGSNTYTGDANINNGTLEIGGAGSLGGGTYAGAIANSGTFKQNSTSDQTLSGDITGTGSLVKDNTGTLTLTGNNTYSGGTTLNAGAGTLVITGVTSVGTGAIVQTDANSILRFDTTGTITNNMTLYNFESLRNVTLSGNINAQDATYKIATGKDTILSGDITGTGKLSQIGADDANYRGSLTLSGNNDFEGDTEVDSVLNVGSATALSAQSKLKVNNDGVVKLNGYASRVAGLEGNGTIQGSAALTAGDENDATFSGILQDGTGAGGLSLTKKGSGKMTLSGANTFSGNTTLDEGSLEVKNAQALGTGSLSQTDGSSSLIFDTTGTVTNNLSIFSVEFLQDVILSGNIIANNATYNVAVGQTATLSGDVSGTGGTTKLGLGTQVLSGNNTYTGANDVQVGTLRAGSTTALGDNVATTVDSGAVLELDGFSNSIGSLAGAGTVENANTTAATLTTGADNTSTTFSGLVQDGTGGGALSLTKTGSGTQTLSGANTYTGGTTLNSGKLTIANNNALGTGTITLAGGTLSSAAGAGYNLSEAIVVNGTTAVFTESNTGGTNFELTGDISGAGTLNFGGTGDGQGNRAVQVRDNLDGFTGTINFDNVSGKNTVLFYGVNTAAALELSGATSGGYLGLQSANATFGELSGTGGRIMSWGRTLTINQDTDTTYAGTMVDANSNNKLTFVKGGTGTLTLTKNNTYTGTTTVDGGTLKLTGSGRIGNGGLTVNNGGTLSVATNAFNSLGGAITVNEGGTLSTDSTGQNAHNIGAIAINGGTLTSSGNAYSEGNWIFNGDVTVGGSTLSTISGLAVGSKSGGGTFNVADSVSGAGTDLLVTASMVDASGGSFLTKTGAGTMTLSGNKTYTGITTINQGTLELASSGLTVGHTVIIDGATDGTATMQLTGNANNMLSDAVVTIQNGGTLDDATTGNNVQSMGTITFNNGGTMSSSDVSPQSTYGNYFIKNGVIVTGNAAATINATELSLNGTQTFNVADATGNASSDLTISSEINEFGGGSLIKTGAGMLTLTGANTYTGGTGIREGTVNFTDQEALGTGTVVMGYVTTEQTLEFGATGMNLDNSFFIQNTNGANRTIRLDVAGTATGVISGNTDLRLTSAGIFRYDVGADDTLTNSGNIYNGAGGGAGITKIGSGTLVLSGANSYTGATTVSGGILRLQGSVGFDAGLIPGTSMITVENGAELNVASAWNTTTDNQVVLNGGTLNFTAGSATDANNYLNTITLNDGAQMIGNALRMGFQSDASITVGGSSASTISSGVMLVNAQNGTPQRTVTFDVADVTSNASTDLLVSGVIADHPAPYGAATLSKTGAGTLTLSGANTYTGNTTVNAGTLKIGNTNALGAQNAAASKVTVASGGTVDFNGVGNAGYGYTIAGTGVGGNGALVNNGAAITTGTKQTSNITLSADASIGGTGDWALLAAAWGPTTLDLATNTLTKSGANTFSLANATVTAGSLQIDGGTFTQIANNKPGGHDLSAVAVSLANTAGATLDLNDLNLSVGSLANGGSTGGNIDLGTGTLTVGDLNASTSYAGVISGTGGLAKTGSGTQTLTGANSYTGTTTIDAGTLEIGGAGTLGTASSNTISIASGATLDYNSSATQTLNGVISGDGALILNGTGQLNLSVNNSFTGGVTVNDGILGLQNGGIGANGPLTVNGGLVSASIHDSFDDLAVSELSGSGGLIEASRRTFTVNQATNTTYAGIIQDLNGIVSSGNGTTFTKIGSGTLTLTGDNTYSKTTNVNGGTLEVSGGLYSAGTNGVSSNINIGATGTLDVTGAGSLGLGAVFNGNIANSGTFNYNSTTDQELSGIISGASVLTKDNTSTLTLSGANTYTGNTTINAGTLKAGSDSAFTGKGQLTTSGGTFDLGGFNAAFTQTNSGAGTITNSVAGVKTLDIGIVSGTLANLITGDTALRVTNPNGVFNLSNTSNTFTGGITLAGGTGSGTRMRLNSASYFASMGSGAITIGESATDRAGIYITAGNNTLSNDIIFNTVLGTDRPGIRLDTTNVTLSGDVTANLSDALFSTNGTGSVNLTGQVTGTNGLTLDNTYGSSITVTLNNANENNDYAGDTTIAGTKGTLVLGRSNQIANGAGKGDLVNNGTLNMNGFSDTINGLSGSGTIDGVSGTSTLTLGDGDADGNTFSGVIKNTAGTLALTKTGSGTQTLTGANSYTGATTVDGGTLVLTASSNYYNYASSQFNINNGSTLKVGNTLFFQNDTFVFGSTGGGTLEIGAGNNVFRGDNTFTTLGGSQNAITGTSLNSDGGGTRTFNVSNGTDDVDLLISAQIANNASIAKTGAGTMELTSANAYTGGTTLSAGTLVLGNASGAGTGTITQTDGTSTLRLNTTGTITNDISLFNLESMQSVTLSGAITANNATYDIASGTTTTISGDITGGGGTIKEGLGTLVLSGTNTYTGNTEINDGTLSLSSSTSNNNIDNSVSIIVGANGTFDVSAITASGGFQLANGQTLAGTGDVDGATQMMAGSNLSAGDGGVGELSFLTSLDVASASAGSLLFDLGSAGTGDLIDVTGNLNIGNGLLDLDDFVFTNLGATSVTGTYTWNLFQATTFDFANLGSNTTANIFGSYSATLAISGGNVVQLTMFVPEPSSTALLGLGGLALMLRRKRS